MIMHKSAKPPRQCAEAARKASWTSGMIKRMKAVSPVCMSPDIWNNALKVPHKSTVQH